MNLRKIEDSKIKCAKKLYNSLPDGNITYDVVSTFDDLMNKVLK